MSLEKDELLNIVTTYSIEQIDNYIEQLETRVKDTQMLIRELRTLRKKKLGRKTFETGVRGGL